MSGSQQTAVETKFGEVREDYDNYEGNWYMRREN